MDGFGNGDGWVLDPIIVAGATAPNVAWPERSPPLERLRLLAGGVCPKLRML